MSDISISNAIEHDDSNNEIEFNDPFPSYEYTEYTVHHDDCDTDDEITFQDPFNGLDDTTFIAPETTSLPQLVEISPIKQPGPGAVYRPNLQETPKTTKNQTLHPTPEHTVPPCSPSPTGTLSFSRSSSSTSSSSSRKRKRHHNDKGPTRKKRRVSGKVNAKIPPLSISFHIQLALPDTQAAKAPQEPSSVDQVLQRLSPAYQDPNDISERENEVKQVYSSSFSQLSHM